jgi:hypothetical protein
MGSMACWNVNSDPSSPRTPRRPRERGARWTGWARALRALPLVGLAAACGCAAPGEVHPDFVQLEPINIAVLTPRNETMAQLDNVNLSSLLQRSWLNSATYNIPSLLQGALEESVLQRGYALGSANTLGGVDPRKPSPDGTKPAGCDAALLCWIESWRTAPQNYTNFSMRYRLELRRTGSAELLYSGVFDCDHRDDPRSTEASRVDQSIRRSAQRALASLPAATRGASRPSDASHKP